jgi:hypothetical protein
MEAKKMKILEALQMQPLSEEEKASRHILGRLYGPIATTKEKTRNGRGYNKELWEKALSDEIFREKVANKSLFLELGHPLDREETDMEKVCACIPEMPKIVDGDLYAYVDILDTANGRLLKTLCDYGFVPGISSRGSGDIMSNDEVDPETFFLETWDIVQLPAVKKARLSVCESLGSKTLTMALRESLEKASDDERAEMKETLDKLDISLGEEVDPTVPFAPDPVDEENVLLEKVDEEEETEEEEIEIEVADDEEAAEEDIEVTDAYTVDEMIAQLQDYDGKLDLEFKPIVIEDKEYEITALEFDDSEEGKIVVDIHYNLPETEEDNKLPEDENPEVDVEVSSDEEPAPEEEVEESEEAVDDGDEEVIESLKDMVRQKDELEKEVRDLKNQKTVSDAEVKDLKEQLEKYKTGFMRVSELASKSTALDKEVKSLKEQLESRDSKINDLQSQIKTHTSLTESVNADKAKVKALTEKLVAVQTEAEESEGALRSQLTESKKAAQHNANVARKYKERCNALTERYIATKANMLGVRPTDITSRLAENYTLDDIDQVCENLLNMGRPAFGLGLGKPKVTINESAVPTKKAKPVDPNNGYDIDDDLLILAGLK